MDEAQEAPQETPKISGEQVVVTMYYDLAINQLYAMANQLAVLKQGGAADHFMRSANKLIEKRNGYMKHARGGIEIVSAGALATGAA